MESIKKTRVDLEQYDIDLDRSYETKKFGQTMMGSLSSPSVVMTYRPSNFFSSLFFPKIEKIEYLGLFHELQAPFEHKPWVESELKKYGVSTVPWHYYSKESDINLLIKITEKWPIIVRSSRSSGGVGLVVINTPEELIKHWPKKYGEYLSIAPFLEPSIPLNVNACIFPDGTISLHSVSLQLIGICELTNRYFGYCGNDFAEIKNIDPKMIDQLEKEVKLIGQWMANQGYRGAFGIDSLLFDGKIFFTEINPRFQGSSDISSQINKEIGLSDMYLEHIAAFWDLNPPKELHLRELLKEQPEISQIVPHNTKEEPVYLRKDCSVFFNDEYKLDLLPGKDISILPNAALCRIIFKGSATKEGHFIRDMVQPNIKNVINLFSK